MTSQTIAVLKPGLATTVQDKGRFGFYHLGLPPGGALDQLSAHLANRLVGNDSDAAVLECTYMGPELRFEQETTLAVTGAPVDVKVDGELVSAWRTLRVPAGSTLSFGVIKGGSRFYIAVAGGIDVPLVLGSRSTYLAGSLGGYNGRKLAAGDVLPVGDVSEISGLLEVPESARPTFESKTQVRIVPGLYHHKLSEKGASNLVNEPWKLTPVADRAGFRFKGPGVEWKDLPQPFGAGSDSSNIVDAGYPIGSIQIPGGTQPIVLHRDAVSGGGYAMVGTVISSDLDLIARVAPGSEINFVPVTLEEAVLARKEYQRRFDVELTSL